MPTPLTQAFDQIAAEDLPHVGGKGANLGEMIRAGFPVPPGFCVTTEAFRRFMAAVDGAEALYRGLEALRADDVDAVRRLAEEARLRLYAAAVPAEVADAVRRAWERLGPEHAYAVRSSATAEDLPGASFAGQHDTFLNVRGEGELIDRVRACWASVFTDRAILYRARSGFVHRSVEIAVVVQRMVVPDVAGVLFTADPVTGNRNVASIDASFGLGEALVSGLVSADLYKVDKRTGVILLVRGGDKRVALRPAPGGGVVREDLSAAARSERALGNPEIRRLAEVGARIEAHYGSPQDIEWALAGDRLFVLQSRPITSLFPLPAPAPDDGRIHIYFSVGHGQMMTDPISPMGISIWRLMVPFGKSGPGYSSSMCVAGGRLYLDITPLLRSRPLRRLVPRLLAAVDRLASRALAEFVQNDDLFEGGGASGRARPLRLARAALPILREALERLWRLPPEQALSTLAALTDERIRQVEDDLAAAAPGASRLRAAVALLDTLLRKIARPIGPFVLAGVLATALAARLAGAGSDDAVNALARGLSGNVTTEMDLAVGDLADLARRSPELVREILSGSFTDARRAARDISGAEAFFKAWDGFLEHYGMRGPSEIDIARPRYRDEPTPLLKAVAGNLEHAEPGAHRARHRRLAAEGEAAAARLVAAAGEGPLGFARAAIMRRLTRVARRLLAVREHPKFAMIRALDRVRAAVLEAAGILLEYGRIDELSDIWYLELPEAVAALEDPGLSLRPRIARRRADYARYRAMSPPRVLTSAGEALTAGHGGEGLPAGALAGTPASSGVAVGSARVVHSPDEQVLRHGEILVASFTDPGWTPLFINAAGLVTEVGGLMTHGSVVAREYGIPAVVCVPDATKRITTGQRVRVDGTLGYVLILDHEGKGEGEGEGEGEA